MGTECEKKLSDGEQPPREAFKKFDMGIIFEKVQADASSVDSDGRGDGNPMEAKRFDRNGMPVLGQETNF